MPTVHKTRFHVFIDDAVFKELNVYVAENALTRGISRSSVIEEALTQYLEPEDPTPAIFRALNRIENRQATTSARVNMLWQVFLHFMRYFFILWPDMTDDFKRELIDDNYYSRRVASIKNVTELWYLLSLWK